MSITIGLTCLAAIVIHALYHNQGSPAAHDAGEDDGDTDYHYASQPVKHCQNMLSPACRFSSTFATCIRHTSLATCLEVGSLRGDMNHCLRIRAPINSLVSTFTFGSASERCWCSTKTTYTSLQAAFIATLLASRNTHMLHTIFRRRP